MRKLAMTLLASTTALASVANASSSVREEMGPVMANPTPEQLTERCDFYLGKVDLYRDALTGDTAEATIDSTLERYNAMVGLLYAVGGEFTLYQQVLPDVAQRETASDCTERTSVIWSEIALSRTIYDRMAAIDLSGADELTRSFVKDRLESFERSGVALPDAERARVQEINAELGQLSTQFARNIAEDVRTIEVSLAELEGLPQDFIDAREANAEGIITLTTASPDYRPVMKYAASDDLRRRYAELYGQRAWPQNDAVLRQIFELRRELATILGRPSYAALDVENKMLDTPAKVAELIAATDAAARPVAQSDYARMLAVLQELSPGAERIEPWQTSWLSPKTQQALYDYDPRETRQYFEYDRVRDGVFSLIERLFEVEIRNWETPLWHEDAEAFEMVENGEVIGRFYLDSHPRAGKYTHANHIAVYPGDAAGPPVSAVVQNMPKGLMEHGQVETFLHEFGHAIHAMFGSSHRYFGQRYNSVERDFIEAPSQMLENWVYDYDTLATFAVNADGATIPRELVEKMNRVRYFNRGLNELGQLGLSNVALKFYTEPVPADLGAATRQWRNEYDLTPAAEFSEMQAAFGHLDGYGAAYYTYGWSRVIAEDMFSRFKAEGLNNPQTARDYRTLVLAPGGTKPAAELVRDFLGRDISLDAFQDELAKGLE